MLGCTGLKARARLPGQKLWKLFIIYTLKALQWYIIFYGLKVARVRRFFRKTPPIYIFVDCNLRGKRPTSSVLCWYWQTTPLPLPFSFKNTRRLKNGLGHRPIPFIAYREDAQKCLPWCWQFWLNIDACNIYQLLMSITVGYICWYSKKYQRVTKRKTNVWYKQHREIGDVHLSTWVFY